MLNAAQQEISGIAGGLAGFAPASSDVSLRARHESDIARVLGAAAWSRLTPDIRRRFGGSHARRQVFEGIMATVECSWPGWLLAQFARLLGTPLAPCAGRHVPVTVYVGPADDGRGVEWRRDYRFPGGRNITVRSAKILEGNSRFLEVVGGGFGMLLDVYERDHALHFLSTRYFWEAPGARFYLPHLLTPGTAHVVHEDVGGGRFRFVITIVHALLGRMFFQDGIFAEEGES